MRTTAAAVAFAIAATSVSANVRVGDAGPGKAGKSGAKSGKSDDCADCSADTLTRANMETNLFFGNLGDDNNEITQASIADFCSEGPEATAALLQALSNASGCLVHNECVFQNIVKYVYSGENNIYTEGLLQAFTIGGLCYADQNGVIVPEGGCDYIDPCETINNGGGDVLLAGLSDNTGSSESSNPFGPN